MGTENTADSLGQLYVVATPIGNLNDISQRALQILETADWIAAEDTRHSKKLCQHFGINTPLISLHDFNEQTRSQELLGKLKNGETGALVSDAGTPLISDPGYHLVKLLRAHEVKVCPVPGPSAMITALSAAGMPTDRFSFEGFLPAKNTKREDALSGLKEEERTLVFYESPHRLEASLKSFETVFGGEREMVVARELTKHYEQFVSGTIASCLAYFESHSDKVRGEFVIILGGSDQVVEQVAGVEDKLIKLLLSQNLPVKQLSEIVAGFYGLKKKAVYQKALDFKSQDE